MKIGLARISTATGDQRLDSQIDELKKAGCEKLFTEEISGGSALAARTGLRECLDFAREGDCIAVWRLDRLARSLPNLLAIVTELTSRKITLVSLTEGIDTSTPTGTLLLHLLGSVAQFEKSVLVLRTKSGLAAARARGRVGGRPRTVTDEKIRMATVMLREPDTTVKQVCQVLGISKGSLYRHLRVADLRAAATHGINGTPVIESEEA